MRADRVGAAHQRGRLAHEEAMARPSSGEITWTLLELLAAVRSAARVEGTYDAGVLAVAVEGGGIRIETVHGTTVAMLAESLDG